MKSHSLFSCLSRGLHGSMEDEPLPSPPPAIEVFPADVSAAQIVKSKPFVTDTVNLQGGTVLLKGRVTSADTLGIVNSDLVAGKYEGGLKLWECAIDLVNILQGEVKDGRLSFRGKRVLELGCGHGLPGIYACLKGASAVHFQDFNVEVLQGLTVPNVNANLERACMRQDQAGDSGQAAARNKHLVPDVHFYAGDWQDMESLLSLVEPEPFGCICEDDPRESSANFCDGDSLQGSLTPDHREMKSYGHLAKHSRKLSGSRACERGSEAGDLEGGYDIILMSETVYSLASLSKLHALIKKCLRPPYGVIYLAGKKHYFGVGGGTRPFKNIVEEDGLLGAHLVTEFADGSSNVREIWKFFFR